jgi:hypothetical protein
VSGCQSPLCPGAGIVIPIDCHDTHSLSGKIVDNFQSDTRGAADYHRCAFQLSQGETPPQDHSIKKDDPNPFSAAS